MWLLKSSIVTNPYKPKNNFGFIKFSQDGKINYPVYIKMLLKCCFFSYRGNIFNISPFLNGSVGA